MRAAGILVFCLFSSILSTVTSLKCQTCFSVNECERGEVVECKEDEEFCSTLVITSSIRLAEVVARIGTAIVELLTFLIDMFSDTEATHPLNTTTIPSATNNPVTLIIKACSRREHCHDDLFSTTTVDGRFEIARAKCCQTDLCNAEPLVLEKYEEFQPNGLQCPGCYAPDEDSCEANQTAICVGKEDQCLTMTSTTVIRDTTSPAENFTEKSTYQGCTTKNSCFFPLGLSEIASGLVQFNITTVECRNASSSELDLH